MMLIYLPVKFEFGWTNRFPVRVGQTNVGHINLIGGLVTGNPPNNILLCLGSLAEQQ